jgi:hypothetical protein
MSEECVRFEIQMYDLSKDSRYRKAKLKCAAIHRRCKGDSKSRFLALRVAEFLDFVHRWVLFLKRKERTQRLGNWSRVL